jgi:HAD superfamily hydrolase (TIGR01509 family)
MEVVVLPEKWIVFDAMGVIFMDEDDTNDLLVPFLHAREPGLTKDSINTVYKKASLGNISSAEFWKELGFTKAYPRIELEYLETLRLDPQFLPAASKLERQYNLALLSNDVAEWSAYLRGKFKLTNLFQVAIVSGDVGYRKPDPAIYRVLLERIQAEAGDCLFIDDRQKNLDAAAALGFQTIRFQREPPAVKDFECQPWIKSFTELPTVIKEYRFEMR